MLTSASKNGLSTETGTEACAARWKITSGRRCRTSSSSPSPRTSRLWKRNPLRPVAPAVLAQDRLWSEPVERSSTTSTSWPSARSRSTSVEPMKPAPPVTSARTAPSLRSSLGEAGRLEHRSRLHLGGAAHHAPARDTGPFADDCARAEHRPIDDGAGSDRRPAQHDARPDDGSCAHLHILAEDRRGDIARGVKDAACADERGRREGSRHDRVGTDEDAGGRLDRK